MPNLLTEGGILFFFPPYPHLGEGPSDGFSKMPRIPLGPASVFEYVAQHTSIPCSFYYSEDHSKAAIARAIRERKPAIVAISCFSYNRFACLSIARIAKAINPSIKVVLGGAHPTFLDEQMLRHYSFIDYIVRGEGEVTFYELVQSLRQGKGLGLIDGVSYRQGDRVVRTKPRVRAKSLDGFPLIDYRKFTRQRRFNKLDKNNVNSFPVETSRGCAFACAFCETVALWGRRIASRRVEHVIEQIRMVPRQEGRTLLFNDMNLTLNEGYIEALCAALRKHRIHIPWYCATRVDLVNKRLLGVMKSAGCAGIFFGIESLSEKILQAMNKQYLPEQAIQNVNLTVKMGIYTQLSFIIGYPGETEKTLQEFWANCRKLSTKARASVNPLMIIPGSAVYAQAVKEGFDESYWLKEHHDIIPYYEGALLLAVLKKWTTVFNTFFKPPLV